MVVQHENQNRYGALPQSLYFKKVTSRLWFFLDCVRGTEEAKQKTKHTTPWKQHFHVTWQTDVCFDTTESSQISPNCQLCSLQLLSLRRNYFNCHKLFIPRKAYMFQGNQSRLSDQKAWQPQSLLTLCIGLKFWVQKIFHQFFLQDQTKFGFKRKVPW